MRKMTQKEAGKRGADIRDAKKSALRFGLQYIDLPAHEIRVHADGTVVDMAVPQPSQVGSIVIEPSPRPLEEVIEEPPNDIDIDPGGPDFAEGDEELVEGEPRTATDVKEDEAELLEAPAPDPMAAVAGLAGVTPEAAQALTVLLQTVMGVQPGQQLARLDNDRPPILGEFQQAQAEAKARHEEFLKTYVPPATERTYDGVTLRIRYAAWLDQCRSWFSIKRRRKLTDSEVFEIIVAHHFRYSQEERALMADGAGPADAFNPTTGEYDVAT